MARGDPKWMTVQRRYSHWAVAAWWLLFRNSTGLAATHNMANRAIDLTGRSFSRREPTGVAAAPVTGPHKAEKSLLLRSRRASFERLGLAHRAVAFANSANR